MTRHSSRALKPSGIVVTQDAARPNLQSYRLNTARRKQPAIWSENRGAIGGPVLMCVRFSHSTAHEQLLHCALKGGRRECRRPNTGGGLQAGGSS
jgi:hypothetical protein